MRIESFAKGAGPGPGSEIQPQRPDSAVVNPVQPTTAAEAAGKEQRQPVEPDRASLDEALAKISRTASALNCALEFEVTDSKRIMIKVIDAESKEVIREIPPERLLEILRGVEESIGLLLDQKV